MTGPPVNTYFGPASRASPDCAPRRGSSDHRRKEATALAEYVAPWRAGDGGCQATASPEPDGANQVLKSSEEQRRTPTATSGRFTLYAMAAGTFDLADAISKLLVRLRQFRRNLKAAHPSMQQVRGAIKRHESAYAEETELFKRPLPDQQPDRGNAEARRARQQAKVAKLRKTLVSRWNEYQASIAFIQPFQAEVELVLQRLPLRPEWQPFPNAIRKLRIGLLGSYQKMLPIEDLDTLELRLHEMLELARAMSFLALDAGGEQRKAVESTQVPSAQEPQGPSEGRELKRPVNRSAPDEHRAPVILFEQSGEPEAPSAMPQLPPAIAQARVPLPDFLRKAEGRTADPKLRKKLVAVLQYQRYFEDLRVLKAACKRYQTPALLEQQFPNLDVWAPLDDADKADIAKGNFQPGLFAWSLVKRVIGLSGHHNRTLKNYRSALRKAGLL